MTGLLLGQLVLKVLRRGPILLRIHLSKNSYQVIDDIGLITSSQELVYSILRCFNFEACCICSSSQSSYWCGL